MITVTATKLRNHLFDFLGKVANGESVSIKRNGKVIAILIPAQKSDWRDKIVPKAKLLVHPDKVFESMEDMLNL